MGLKVKKKKGASVPPIDGGTYPAVCIGVVDTGEQYSDLYKNYRDMVLLIWELPGQTVSVDGEDKPRWLSKDFSASLNEKSNLYKFIKDWRSKPFTDEELSGEEGGFDLREMLGQGCLLAVSLEAREDGTPRNKVNSAIAFPTGMAAPTPTSELLAFDMDAWDDAVLEKLPGWVQDRIKKSTQYQKLHTPADEVDFKDQKKESQTEGECPI